MVKPTPPTAPEAPLRSDAAFSAKAQTFLTWLSGGFYSYVEDSVDFVDERADEALAAATTFGFPSIAGKGLNLTRVNAAGTALEFRTPVQVRGDIGAMAQPTFSVGLGQVAGVYADQNTVFAPPAGGIWWGRWQRRNKTSLGNNGQGVGLYSGGTGILTCASNEDCFGDFIRVE
jgi:hypothetical protein